MKKNHIILNDNEIDISKSDPNSSLLDWIRLEKQLHGTKEGCAEGDCGACSILLSPVNGGKLRPANSCLLKLGQVVGSSVYTEDPTTCPNFNKHEFAGLSFPPLTGDKSILQAPQSPSAQPSFVPWSCFSSLIQSNKEEFGSDFDISISLSFNII